VVVGTDGSESSLRAGAVAGACGATPVVACAHLPTETDDRVLARAQDVLGDEAYQVVGSHPVPAGATRRSPCDALVVHTTG